MPDRIIPTSDVNLAPDTSASVAYTGPTKTLGAADCWIVARFK